MKNKNFLTPRFLAAPLTAALLSLQTAACSAPADTPTLAPAAAPSATAAPGTNAANQGTVFSIMSTTQGNFGKLGIGVGYIGGGPYLDEKNVRQDGLHAGLSIAVEGDASQFSQPDVHEGQFFEVDGYRIRIEKLNPGDRGSVVLRIWAPAKPKANKSWLHHFFGLN